MIFKEKNSYLSKNDEALLTPNQYMFRIINDYISHLKEHCYIEHPAAKITSGIDKTVILIGSAISVLKPYLLSDRIPDEGFVMSQPCIRTRNLAQYSDDTFCPNYGSMFYALGALAKPFQLKNLSQQIFSLFNDIWGVPYCDIRVRLSSKDTDLINVVSSILPTEALEIDTKKIEYYRHKIGIDGILGRNFNIALRDQGMESFSDVGNIILLQKGFTPLGVEVGLGAPLITKSLLNLPHMMDCHQISGIEHIKEPGIKIRMKDCIVTSMALYNEGIEPTNKGSINKLFKRYMDIMSATSSQIGLSISQLQCILEHYEQNEYPTSNRELSKKITAYVNKKNKGIAQNITSQNTIQLRNEKNNRERE